MLTSLPFAIGCRVHAARDLVTLATTPVLGPTSTWTRKPSVRARAIHFEQAPSRGIDVIADALRTYERHGLLKLGDARLAAAQFAYLVLGIPQDRAQFCPQERPSPAERDRLAAEAVRVFLAAYQRSHEVQI